MILKSLLLLLPLTIWAGLIFFQRLSTREKTASFLGFVWMFQASLIINVIAVHIGAWTFLAPDNLFYGVPLDEILSLSIFAGALLPMSRHLNCNLLSRLLLQFLLLISIFLIGSSEVLTFLTTALLLTTLLLAGAFGLLLSEWTALEKTTLGRVLIQSLAWASILFWLFPSTVFILTTDNWQTFLQRDLLINLLLAIPFLVPAYLLCSALYQFATVGKGTAFPFDPPKFLVTTGVYRFLSNPMQVGICSAMCWWGMVLQSLWIISSAVVAVLLFVVFKNVCNGSSAIGADNNEWDKYQASVPKWWPETSRRCSNTRKLGSDNIDAQPSAERNPESSLGGIQLSKIFYTLRK